MNRPGYCVIADDVRAYRLQIKSWLAAMGFKCREFARAKLAWEVIREQRPELVVTDIDMPQISGFQLIRAVRCSKVHDLSSVPIIAVSGLCDPEIDRFVRQVGASQFVPKPLEKEQFDAAVATVTGADFTPRRHGPLKSGFLDREFPQISPILRRLATEAIEQPISDSLGER